MENKTTNNPKCLLEKEQRKDKLFQLKKFSKIIDNEINTGNNYRTSDVKKLYDKNYKAAFSNKKKKLLILKS